jgi:hypothetical protein
MEQWFEQECISNKGEISGNVCKIPYYNEILFFLSSLIITFLLLIFTNEWNIINVVIIFFFIYRILVIGISINPVVHKLLTISLIIGSLFSIFIILHAIITKSWFPFFISSSAHLVSSFLLYSVISTIQKNEKIKRRAFDTFLITMIYEVIEVIFFFMQLVNLSWDMVDLFWDIIFNIIGIIIAIMIEIAFIKKYKIEEQEQELEIIEIAKTSSKLWKIKKRKKSLIDRYSIYHFLYGSILYIALYTINESYYVGLLLVIPIELIYQKIIYGVSRINTSHDWFDILLAFIGLTIMCLLLSFI